LRAFAQARFQEFAEARFCILNRPRLQQSLLTSYMTSLYLGAKYARPLAVVPAVCRHSDRSSGSTRDAKCVGLKLAMLVGPFSWNRGCARSLGLLQRQQRAWHGLSCGFDEA
jgi:hypothetical protein